jgi:iron complex outermembrane receptor protein
MPSRSSTSRRAERGSRHIERRLTDNWSMDASLSYSGERWGDTANTFKTPAFTLLNLGVRSRFALSGRPAELRVLASNLTGVEGYSATRSGILSPIAPRTVRALLTVTFGGKAD